MTETCEKRDKRRNCRNLRKKFKLCFFFEGRILLTETVFELIYMYNCGAFRERMDVPPSGVQQIDFNCAEFKRRVGRTGFALGQMVFGRDMRLPHLKTKYFDLHLVARESTNEMHRSEATRLATASGVTESADRRTFSTATHNRKKTPLRPLNRASQCTTRSFPLRGH